MQTAYKLYGRPGSGSLAVQAALEEIGAPYERIWVGREPADVERLRKVIPTARVPALVLPDGTVMFESAAMLIQLAIAHPSARLAPPTGAGNYPLFLQWMVFLSANVYEAALRVYYSARYSIRKDADADAIREQGSADFLAYLNLIGDTLAPYVLGNEFSIADTYLYMLGSWYPEGKLALYARLPKLAAHGALVSSRPAVAKVDADHAAAEASN
jgi:glutathione S-transferase